VQVDAPLPPGLAAQQRKMKAILEGEILEAALALGGGEPVCDTRMMSLGYLWATGWALPDMTRMIRSEVDVSGDLVGALRRAKDLTGQLREVLSDDPARQTELKLILHKISRDEVEAL
jgi:superfamily II RNA helicase